LKVLVIAGTASGVGKTTVSTGLMGTLRRLGLRVQPFKGGPDYIDPSYHALATGVPSRNLDTWMLPGKAVLELFNRAMASRDIGVIEGVMGLYDGRFSTSDEGSTAELAKLLGAPVILVVDSRKGARSMAALVEGYKSFDPSVKLCGAILNGIGSEGHLRLCREAIEHYTGLPVVGYLPRRDNLTLPERHLGLVPAGECPPDEGFIDRLVTLCHSCFDVARILDISESGTVPDVEPWLFPEQPKPHSVRIGVARDKAFSFYYQDNLDLLSSWGAEIVPFSPLEDTDLPENISGIYIGGGFPEIHAADLSDNTSIRRQIREAAVRGLPVYGECGGLMYLGHKIRDFEGKEHPMVGAIPVSSHIDSPRLSLGYRTVKAMDDGPVLSKNETVRGHEFHWSVLDDDGDCANAYQVQGGEGRKEGFRLGGLLASYIHLHFGSLPSMARHFVEKCERYR
jgi:cobyrinic acid a,c-diamide synthase